MRVSQLGAPSVSLSSVVAPAGTAAAAGFVAINVHIKIEDRASEDPAVVGHIHLSEDKLLVGKVIERRPSGGWLLFWVPRELCQEGGVLTLCALQEDIVLWEKAYRVVWRERFPGLEPVE